MSSTQAIRVKAICGPYSSGSYSYHKHDYSEFKKILNCLLYDWKFVGSLYVRNFGRLKSDILQSVIKM